MSMIRNKEATQKKEAVLAMAMETPGGREVIAQAMQEPIRNALNYQGVARKIYMVDELGQGAYPRYERDVTVKSWVIGKRAGVPEHVVEAEDLFIPTLELAAFPQIRIQEVKSRRFYVVDRAQVKAKDSLARQEDTLGFKVLNAAVPAAHNLNVVGALELSNINHALTMIEEHELVGAKLIMSPARFKDVRGFGKEVYDEATQRQVLQTGLYGHLYTADIHVSTMVPKNCVYVTAPAQYLGAMPIRTDVSVIPADDPRKLRLGWVVYEDVGFGVINDYAVARIKVEAS